MQAQRTGALVAKVEIVEETMHEGTISGRVIESEKDRPPQAKAASRRQVIIGAAGVFGSLAVISVAALASATEEISHTAEAIHQEVVFKASRKRVYEALTDTMQFNKVVLLSAAMSPAAWLRDANRWRSAPKWAAPFPHLAATSPDAKSNSSLTRESCRPGARAVGNRVNIRLQNSS